MTERPFMATIEVTVLRIMAVAVAVGAVAARVCFPPTTDPVSDPWYASMGFYLGILLPILFARLFRERYSKRASYKFLRQWLMVSAASYPIILFVMWETNYNSPLGNFYTSAVCTLVYAAVCSAADLLAAKLLAAVALSRHGLVNMFVQIFMDCAIVAMVFMALYYMTS